MEGHISLETELLTWSHSEDFPQHWAPRPFPLSSPFSLLNVASLILFSQLLMEKVHLNQGYGYLGANMADKVSSSQ